MRGLLCVGVMICAPLDLSHALMRAFKYEGPIVCGGNDMCTIGFSH